ncbi:MAG: protein-disulfide reductase DsbD N-terminal domain-containing protein [Pseudomonadota bacterium]
MPAHKIATESRQVAVLRHGLFGLCRKAVISVFTGLILAGTHPLLAADLPTTYSDTAPAAESALKQGSLLQTNSTVLPVDVAFALTSFIEAATGANINIVLRWEMPPGYYLYQKSLVVEDANGKVISLELPDAKKITDEYFGEVAVYYSDLLLRLPLKLLDSKPGTTINLLLTYQGCAEALYCYPPEQKALTLELPE